VHHQARQILLSSKDKSKEYYDQTTVETKLKIGDKVLLYNEIVRRGRSSKLIAKWIGPYVLTELEKANATITRGRLLQMRPEFAALIVWTMLKLAAGENGYELSIYQETPGVYFEDLGQPLCRPPRIHYWYMFPYNRQVTRLLVSNNRPTI
jgi:hypothetical protein